MQASARLVLVTAVTTAVTAALASPAAAQNLLANPGFETGTFAGFAVGGNATGFGVASDGTVVGGTAPVYGPSSVVARSGRFAAFALVCQAFDAESCPAAPEVLTLSQQVAVVPNARYELGLWVGARTPGSAFAVSVLDDFFQLSADGVGLLAPGAFVVPGDGTFQRISATFDAGGRSSVVVTYRLTGSGTGRALLSADDLFLVQVVPEPATAWLVGVGVAVLGGFAKRRRRHGREAGPPGGSGDEARRTPVRP
jgi:hypothetical protein